ncbi:MAG TPA: hypothetical protein PKW90_19880 [Myxococcota bacterium]|nr:hypothetical protein [Myxococcota bacterium]
MAAWKIAPFAAEPPREWGPQSPAEEAAELFRVFWRLGRGLLRLAWWLIGPAPAPRAPGSSGGRPPP